MANSSINPTLNPEEENLARTVREKIERMILAGEIPAGERLNEYALASQLNVSRGPIREAARYLEHAGLVEIVHNRGVIVRNVSLEDALHVYDVRAGLYRVAGRLLALRATPEQIAEFEAIYQAMERAAEIPDQAAYNERNREFHTKLVEFAGNPRLIAMHDATQKELYMFMRRGVLGAGRFSVSNAEHRQMLDSVIEGNAERAAAAFERHIIKGKQRMLDSLVYRQGSKGASGNEAPVEKQQGGKLR